MIKKFLIEHWLKLIIGIAILIVGTSTVYYSLMRPPATPWSRTVTAPPFVQNKQLPTSTTSAIVLPTPAIREEATSTGFSLTNPKTPEKRLPFSTAPNSSQGAISQNLVSQNQIATPPPPSSTATSMASQNNTYPPEIAINPQTLVGILCYYNVTYTNQDNNKSVATADQWEVRGSGVIVNSKGNILTNRHIIEQPKSFTAITGNNGNSIPVAINYSLDRCEAGQLPVETQLPTVAEIQTLNPYVNIPVLGYTAQPVFIPSTNGLSAAEVQDADFAILQITGVSKNGPTFGVNAVPSSFPYAKLLPVRPYAMVGKQVLTYGFPGNVTSGQGNFFETLTMTGSVGRVTDIDFGDSYYADTPLAIYANMEIAHGRSGSPLFWKGYVIGLVTFFLGENQTNSGSVASDAILKGLGGTNYIGDK